VQAPWSVSAIGAATAENTHLNQQIWDKCLQQKHLWQRTTAAPTRIAPTTPVEVGRAPTAVHKPLNAEKRHLCPLGRALLISPGPSERTKRVKSTQCLPSIPPGGDSAAVFPESDSAESDSAGLFFYSLLNTMGQSTIGENHAALCGSISSYCVDQDEKNVHSDSARWRWCRRSRRI
jgi:hypothetical protein